MSGCSASDCTVTHVSSAIPGSRRVGEQIYGRCPAHDDREASMGIRRGERYRHVWWCHAGCDPHEMRPGLLHYGIRPECLGDWDGRSRSPRPDRDTGSSDEAGRLRAEIARLRAEIARLRAEIARLRDCVDEPSILLRLRIQAVYEGIEIPAADTAEFRGLATRAGVDDRRRISDLRRAYVSRGSG